MSLLFAFACFCSTWQSYWGHAAGDRTRFASGGQTPGSSSSTPAFQCGRDPGVEGVRSSSGLFHSSLISWDLLLPLLIPTWALFLLVVPLLRELGNAAFGHKCLVLMPNSEGKWKREKWERRREKEKERDGIGFCRHRHNLPSLCKSQDHPRG